MFLDLTNEELKKFYPILALEKGQRGYPAEEWKLANFDKRPIDKNGPDRILEKFSKLLPESDAKAVDRKMLLRKYSLFGSKVNEGIYHVLEEHSTRNRERWCTSRLKWLRVSEEKLNLS